MLIDYADFNLRMAKSLRAKNYRGKIIQYISPSVWAWKKERISLMAKNLDLLLTIYPFEPSYFKDSGLPTYFVGNPISEKIKAHLFTDHWKKLCSIPDSIPMVALFPGSRKGEVTRNLPLLMQTVKQLQTQIPQVCFGISCADSSLEPLILSAIKQEKNIYIVPKKFSYELMRDAHLALAKSGTVTLELACFNCPTIVYYQLSFLNQFLAQYIYQIDLPYYCIVNILGEKEIFPEFIKEQNNTDGMAKAAFEFFQNSEKRALCLQECAKIQQLLAIPSNQKKAADLILQEIFS